MKTRIVSLTFALCLGLAQSAPAISLNEVSDIGKWAGGHSSDNGYFEGKSRYDKHIGISTVYASPRKDLNLTGAVRPGHISDVPGVFANERIYDITRDFISSADKTFQKAYDASALQNAMSARHIISDPFQYRTETLFQAAVTGAYSSGIYHGQLGDADSYVLSASVGLTPGGEQVQRPIPLGRTISSGNDYLNWTKTAMVVPYTALTICSSVTGAAFLAGRRNRKVSRRI